MKTSLVRELRCPRCAAPLQLHAYKSIAREEVIDGVLSCACGAAFPVRAGVPRLIAPPRIPGAFLETYRERLQADAPSLLRLPAEAPAPEFSFSWQWNEHAYDDLTWELRLTERVKLFYRYTGLSVREAASISMLDAGCGNGTLSAELALQGFNVVALDYSDGAVRGYEYQWFQSRVTEQAASRLNYVQGDLQSPPFPDEHFDLIYSDGVLHHTPDTKRTFMTIAPKVKVGGRLFIWLYRSDTSGTQSLKRAAVKAVRAATGWMSYNSRLSLCYLAAFVILSGLRVLRLCGYRGRPVIPIRQKAINLFDTITPTYNHEHTPAETRAWFREAGFTDVTEVTINDHRLGRGGFAMIGTRTPASVT
jgi:SAM-dependent methyltransferase